MIKYICVFSAFISIDAYANNNEANSQKNSAYESRVFPGVSSVFAPETRPPNIPVVQSKSKPRPRATCAVYLIEFEGILYGYYDETDPNCSQFNR